MVIVIDIDIDIDKNYSIRCNYNDEEGDHDKNFETVSEQEIFLHWNFVHWNCNEWLLFFVENFYSNYNADQHFFVEKFCQNNQDDRIMMIYPPAKT